MEAHRDVVFREEARVRSSQTCPRDDPMADRRHRSRNLVLGSKEVLRRVAVGELSSRPTRCEAVEVFLSVISSDGVRTQ